MAVAERIGNDEQNTTYHAGCPRTRRLVVKQGSKLSTRMLRVAAASGIVLGVFAPGAAAFAVARQEHGTTVR